jgi:hypothetical protein
MREERVQGKVVRLRAGRTIAHDGDKHSADAHIREYILDMVRQLACLAEAHGEPLLGLMLDEITYRYDLPSSKEDRSRTGAPGHTV